MNKRIIVIGSIVVDEIFTYSGEHYRSFGGITYTIVALAKLLPEYEILPVTYIGFHEKESFFKFLSQLPNIKFDGVKTVERSNFNILQYVDPTSRIEKFRKETPGLSFENVYPYLDRANAVYINYIKDNDFSLENLRSLSSFFREGWIYIDIHSLIRQVGSNGIFKPTYFQGWQSVVQYADFIQLNEEEAHFFTGFNFETNEELKNLVVMMLVSGPKGVSITLGDRGVIAGGREGGAVDVREIPAMRIDVRDPTGCGDVYGAAVLKRIIEGADFISAAEYGVKIASIKARMPLEEFVAYTIN